MHSGSVYDLKLNQERYSLEFDMLSHIRRLSVNNMDEISKIKESNYKLFFYIVHLQQTLKYLELENETLKDLLCKYNKESIENDNRTIKKALLTLSVVITVLVFLIF